MNIPDSKYISDKANELWQQILKEVGYSTSIEATFSQKTVRLLVRDFYMKGFMDGMNHSFGTRRGIVQNHHRKP